MNKEDILTWLTQLGTGWVSLPEVHEVYKTDLLDFWDKITDWHDGAYVTKRHNTANYEKYTSMGYTPIDSVEQYRLNKRAIDSLEA